ncbi:MAG TPA: hypothetical protein VGO07_01095 [Candidatus Saccharimonadales bacterium]|nr:hypothetical protein [Candidatus Saccharimonadales bacterium]
MPTPPNPNAPLVCADGVAEAVATVDPLVRAEWDAVKAALGPETPICVKHVRDWALGVAGARACIFRETCAMRHTDPPVLAP